MIETWQFVVGLLAAAGLAAFAGVHLGYFLLGHGLRGHVAHWKGEAERWKERAKVAESLRETLEKANWKLKEDAAVTARLHPGHTVLLDRLADREESLAQLRHSHATLTTRFQLEASQLADRIAGERVADLAAVLMTYSKKNAELERRCAERDDDEFSPLDSDLDDYGKSV